MMLPPKRRAEGSYRGRPTHDLLQHANTFKFSEDGQGGGGGRPHGALSSPRGGGVGASGGGADLG